MSLRALETARLLLEIAHFVVEVYDRWASRKQVENQHPARIQYIYYNATPEQIAQIEAQMEGEEDDEDEEELQGEAEWQTG